MKDANALAKQSQQWLMEALIKLMKQKRFSNITICELSETAGVNRKTFYRHFQTKEDILKLYLHQTCFDYMMELQKAPALTTYAIAYAYFSVCQMHREFLCLLAENDMLPLLLSAFDTYLPKLHLVFENRKLSDSPVHNSPYALSFFTGAFWNISVKWMHNGSKETPEEMAYIVKTLMEHPL